MSNYIMHTEPWKHQIDGLEYFMNNDHGALYTDMGSGKSKILIDTFVNRGFRSVLIVAPLNVCLSWVTQIKTHAPKRFMVCDLTQYEGTKSKVSAFKVFNAKYPERRKIILINYESVWRPQIKKLFLKYKFQAVVCDESHKIKSPSSKCSGMLTLLGKRVKHRYLLTGTPMSSPLDIYAQYRFLDSSIFGTRYDDFKARYANYKPIPGGFPVLDKRDPYKNLEELREKMFSIAFHVENIVQNLPDTIDIEVPFYMNDKAQKAYKSMKKDGAVEFSNGFVTTKNILGVIQKLQQITSGYITLEDDDGNKKLVQGDNSRLEAFREIMEDIPSDEPVVVFCRYTQDIKNVQKVLDKLRIKYSELSGRKDTMNSWDKGKTRVLIIQIQSGAEGLNNLVKSRYCIYYTMHPSLQLWKQSRKRQHRPGQERKVVYYTLAARLEKGKTIDQMIIRSLKKNDDLVNQIMSGNISL